MSKIDDIYRMQLIGGCCREHRKDVLKLTLKEFQDKTGIPLKTVSNFECGRSGNLYYMFYYINLTQGTNQKTDFLRKIVSVIGGVLNNG